MEVVYFFPGVYTRERSAFLFSRCKHERTGNFTFSQLHIQENLLFSMCKHKRMKCCTFFQVNCFFKFINSLWRRHYYPYITVKFHGDTLPFHICIWDVCCLFQVYIYENEMIYFLSDEHIRELVVLIVFQLFI